MVGHLREGSVAVTTGDRVRAGQVIGQVGNSGNTAEPHVHIQAQSLPTFDDSPDQPVDELAALIRTLRTYPLVFRNVVLTRDGSPSTPATADPRRGDLVAPASVIVTGR